ncbi:hypothetical protein BKA65DRAFT_490222 [Rhexocercosporidium sp. MPI-PUGE-AT-0058]|nr:hypothetical protein BKA65DRAFT_490222 [Rhexocercosporidium sp. MPI-PUGE-AT-0058]
MEGGRLAEPRSPFIAPKQQVPLSSSQPGSTSFSNLPPGGRRSIPRSISKTGCWTCRTRKVKCDEGRPTCNQCRRLGYTCDNKPRTFFRDNTPKIIQREQRVTTTNCRVWNPSAPNLERKVQASDDILPPFSSLKTDTEREKNAALRSPGTFIVVANVTSFEKSPEYRDASPGSQIPATGTMAEEVKDPNVSLIHTDRNLCLATS